MCGMKFYDALVAGIHHIQRNKLRAGLSILGILIGIASVLCMMAIGDGAKKIIADDLEKLGGFNQVHFWARPYTYHRGKRKKAIEKLTFEDADAIESECPDLLYVLPQNRKYPKWVTSRRKGGISATIEGVTEEYADGIRWRLQYGRFLSENDIHNAIQVCVLGANIATELFGDTSPLGQEMKIRSGRRGWVRFIVVGVMTPRGMSINRGISMDNIVFVPLTTRQQRLTGEDYVERIIVFFQKETDVSSVIKNVKRVIRKRHRGTDRFMGVWYPIFRMRYLERIEKIIKIALGGIAGFSLFVSGIGIMNICFVSVGEKTREIGLRKSIGARRIDIFYQFLTESISLCLCGTIFGIAGGWLFAHGMARVAVRILPIVEVWPVVLSIRWMVISVLFSIFMGIIFGVYPAIRASRMSPIDALRTDT